MGEEGANAKQRQRFVLKNRRKDARIMTSLGKNLSKVERKMPHHFEFDANNKVLLGKLEGHVTEQEFEDFYQIIPLYCASVKPASAIADFTGVTRFDVRKEKVRGIAFMPPAFRDPNRPRVVVAPAPSIFGLARMFQALGAETRPLLSVVHTMDEAFKTLQVEKPRFEMLDPIAVESEQD